MRKCVKIFAWLVMVAMLAVAIPLSAEAQNSPTRLEAPPITLENWKNSSESERYSFLAGLLSYLELERLWQGKQPLPISRSTVETWVKGLRGVSIREMDRALGDYIAAGNPGVLEMSVIEALGRIYVRPKLTGEERAASAKRVAAVRAVTE